MALERHFYLKKKIRQNVNLETFFKSSGKKTQLKWQFGDIFRSRGRSPLVIPSDIVRFNIFHLPQRFLGENFFGATRRIWQLGVIFYPPPPNMSIWGHFGVKIKNNETKKKNNTLCHFNKRLFWNRCDAFRAKFTRRNPKLCQYFLDWQCMNTFLFSRKHRNTYKFCSHGNFNHRYANHNDLINHDAWAR